MIVPRSWPLRARCWPLAAVQLNRSLLIGW